MSDERSTAWDVRFWLWPLVVGVASSVLTIGYMKSNPSSGCGGDCCACPSDTLGDDVKILKHRTAEILKGEKLIADKLNGHTGQVGSFGEDSE